MPEEGEEEEGEEEATPNTSRVRVEGWVEAVVVEEEEEEAAAAEASPLASGWASEGAQRDGKGVEVLLGAEEEEEEEEEDVEGGPGRKSWAEDWKEGAEAGGWEEDWGREG